MPEEILALAIISIMSFTVLSIIGMSLRYKSRKARHEVGAGSSSLTTSELERMMKRAVQDATFPLEEKIERLEDALALQQASKQLEEPRVDLLADMDMHQEPDELASERSRARN